MSTILKQKTACWGGSSLSGSNSDYKKERKKDAGSAHLLVSFAGFEGHLQDFVSKAVSIQAVDRHGSLLIVRHGNKPKAFALTGVKISDHFHIDDGAKRSKQLPQDGLIGFLAQVINEDAPAIWRVSWGSTAADVVNTHGRKPTENQERL